MISLLLILLLLVLLCFFLLLIMLKIENNDVKFVFASENINKGKSILGAPLQLEKVVTKNHKAKKSNNQNSKQKKRHLCHHCGAAGHTRLNCYK